jgi:class 3 adenylate cyclase
VQPVVIAQSGGERRVVTVILCDLADFDAEEWPDWVGAFLDASSAAVTEMGGKVANRLASGIVTLLGHPAVEENDSERAVRAALAIQRALAELKGDNSKRALAARIAIGSRSRAWWWGHLSAFLLPNREDWPYGYLGIIAKPTSTFVPLF